MRSYTSGWQNQDSNPSDYVFCTHFPCSALEVLGQKRGQKSIHSGINSKPEKAPAQVGGVEDQVCRIQKHFYCMDLKRRVAFCLLPNLTKKCSRACQLKNVFMTPKNPSIGDIYFKQSFHHNRKKRQSRGVYYNSCFHTQNKVRLFLAGCTGVELARSRQTA